MKNFKFIVLAIAMALASFVVFAEKTEVDIKIDTAGGGTIRPRTATPIQCFADKDAGYVEVFFRANFGEVEITLTDSTGDVVDEISIDTGFERFATLNIPDPDESYIVRIESDQYAGEGYIL